MLCQSNKPANRVGKVLFIDAKNEVERKNAESRLTPLHINKIVDAYRGFENIDRFAYVATNKEIEKNGCNIGIAHYVMADAPEAEESVDAGAAAGIWLGNAEQTLAAVSELGMSF